MKGFIAGVIFTLGALAAGEMLYTHLGFAPVNADAEPGTIEKIVLAGALDPSVERHAPHLQNPLPANEDNLKRGMAIYTMKCALCHGGIDRKPSLEGKAMFPRAPQFIVRGRGLHDPEWQTFYVTQHGIRRTGMMGWGTILSTDDLWRVTSFLTNLDKLPPALKQ